MTIVQYIKDDYKVIQDIEEKNGIYQQPTVAIYTQYQPYPPLEYRSYPWGLEDIAK